MLATFTNLNPTPDSKDRIMKHYSYHQLVLQNVDGEPHEKAVDLLKAAHGTFHPHPL